MNYEILKLLWIHSKQGVAVTWSRPLQSSLLHYRRNCKHCTRKLKRWWFELFIWLFLKIMLLYWYIVCMFCISCFCFTDTTVRSANSGSGTEFIEWMLRSCRSWQKPFIVTKCVIIGFHQCLSSMAMGIYDMIPYYHLRADLLIYQQIQLKLAISCCIDI